MKQRLLVVAAVSVAAALCALPAPAAADELAQINAQIMNDPRNIELNLRYARAAEARGDYGKALAAYERVLEYEPGNAEARSGVSRASARLQPHTSQVFTEFGGGYESNPQNLSFAKTGSLPSGRDPQGILFGRVLLKDEGTLWDTRWRTTALLSGNLYSSDGDLNYGYAGAATGPVYELSPELTVHPSIGVGGSYFDHHLFYGEVYGTTLFEGRYNDMNYIVRFRGGFREYNDFFPSTRGGFADITTKFLFPAVIAKDDLFVVSPWWRWSGINGDSDIGFLVSPDDFRTGKYNEVGGRVEYFKPVTDIVTVGVNFSTLERYYYRAFDSFVGDFVDRRDFIYGPGAALIIRLPQFTNQSSVRLDYRYERDDSNVPLGGYTNHIGTITFFNRY
jgi:hypothetical protein